MTQQQVLENKDIEQSVLTADCEVAKHWLLMEFPFLLNEGFLSGVESVMLMAETPPESDEQFFAEAMLKVRSIAFNQMESLLELATENGEQAENARKTLGAMLLSNCSAQFESTRAYCLQRAAEGLRFLSENGLPSYLIDCVEISLTARLELPETERIHLLRALLQAAEFSQAQFPPSLGFKRSARILHEALLLEIQRPMPEQSLKYTQLLMDSMASYPHHLALATLNAISLTGVNQSLREMAAAAFHAVAESLEIRWLKTLEDKLATFDSRKERLAELCRMPHDDAYNVQVIFNSLKGFPIKSLDDPRLPAIKTLMSYSMSSVKMANCWSLFAQGDYSPTVDEFVHGLDELTNLAVNSGSAGLSHDAVKLIRSLQKEHPELEEKIKAYTESANLRFVAALTDAQSPADALPLPEDGD